MQLSFRKLKLPLILAFTLALVCLKSTFTPLQAQTLPSAITTSESGKKMVVINGEMQPLFWCEGITRISDLDAYAKSGFNTVVVRLYWGAASNGSLVPQDLQPQLAFAKAAAARGLYVIYGLPAAPYGQQHQFTISARNSAYFLMWESWVRGAMQTLSATPRLIGWMLPDDPRSLPLTSDIDFRAWLSGHYPSITVLNKEWKTRFNDVEEISLESTEAMVDRWNGIPAPQGPMTHDAFRDYARRAAANRGGSPNWAFHPAALTLGLYRRDAFRSLVNAWAQVVHQGDPLHLVFSGQMHDYAELLAMPGSVDVSVPALWPGRAENDIATHNPQAVDIARRAGRFCAMPVLATSLPAPFSSKLPSMRLQAWAEAAVAHGASGLALASWEDVKADSDLQKAVQRVLTTLKSTQNERWWRQAPLATTAILLTPLADGYTITVDADQQALPSLGDQQNKRPNRRQERGLYGFCKNLVAGEPSDLVYAMRYGSQFGSIDYLSPADLGEYSLAHGGILQKYTTLLMPQAFVMPPPVLQELNQFVAGGGIIVADLGIGAATAGNQVVDFAPGLNALLGVVPRRMVTVAFNLLAAPDAGLLPLWGRLAMTPKSVMTAGDGPGGAAFAGPTAFTTLLPGTKQLGLGFQLPYPLGSNEAKNRFLLQRAWLTAAPHGKGLAIYAPFRLWTHWRPGYRGFDAFHRDLLGRGAAITTILNRSLLPSPNPAPGAPQVFPEMINYDQSIALINHTPPEKDTENSQMGAIATGSTGNFLWRNALCVFSSNVDGQILAPRPAPKEMPESFEEILGVTQLFAWVKADATKLLHQVPIRLQFSSGTTSAAAFLHENTTDKLRLVVWPGANAVLPQQGEFRIPLRNGRIRIILNDQSATKGYVIAPNSFHLLTLTDATKPGQEAESPYQEQVKIQADANGQLTLDVNGAALQIELKPAPPPPAPEALANGL